MSPYVGTIAALLGAAALVAVSQLFVRERSADAANRLAVAGGLVAVTGLTRWIPLGPLGGAGPLLTVGAAGCAVWALFLLGDALHPKLEGQKLPHAVAALRNNGEGSSIGGRIFFAVFAVIACVAAGGYYEGAGATKAACALGVVIAILGGHLLHQRGSWAAWVLERRPEWVVWIYPSKLTVVSQRYGTRTVYWRAIVGVQNGLRLMLPASTEQGAAQLAAEVATLCPGASLGHTPELEGRFATSPESMRRGGA